MIFAGIVMEKLGPAFAMGAMDTGMDEGPGFTVTMIVSAPVAPELSVTNNLKR